MCAQVISKSFGASSSRAIRVAERARLTVHSFCLYLAGTSRTSPTRTPLSSPSTPSLSSSESALPLISLSLHLFVSSSHPGFRPPCGLPLHGVPAYRRDWVLSTGASASDVPPIGFCASQGDAKDRLDSDVMPHHVHRSRCAEDLLVRLRVPSMSSIFNADPQPGVGHPAIPARTPRPSLLFVYFFCLVPHIAAHPGLPM